MERAGMHQMAMRRYDGILQRLLRRELGLICTIIYCGVFDRQAVGGLTLTLRYTHSRHGCIPMMNSFGMSNKLCHWHMPFTSSIISYLAHLVEFSKQTPEQMTIFHLHRPYLDASL